MTAYDNDHANEIGLDLSQPEPVADSSPAEDLAGVGGDLKALASKPWDLPLDPGGLTALVNSAGPLLEQARAALQAGQLTLPQFIERAESLLKEHRPTPADEPSSADVFSLAATAAAGMSQGLERFQRRGLGVVGLGLGVAVVAGGAFALGVMAKSAATR